MINLISIQKRKKMRKEFFMRFATVVFVMLGVSFFIAAIALLPAYFSANIKLNITKENLKKFQADLLSPEELIVLETVDSLDKKLKLINNSAGSNYIVSERVIDSVILRKTNAIKINRIDYKSAFSGEREILVLGGADSRDSLLDFRIRLERDPNWEKVDLPVSNFVKGSNIKFSLTLIPAK